MKETEKMLRFVAGLDVTHWAVKDARERIERVHALQKELRASEAPAISAAPSVTANALFEKFVEKVVARGGARKRWSDLSSTEMNNWALIAACVDGG